MDAGKIVEEGAATKFFAAPKTERAQKFLDIFTFEREKEDKRLHQ